MGFGPDHSPIGKLLENGPHAGGWKGRLDAHLLESAFDLMKVDPRLSLGDALQQVDVDLSNIPQSLMNDIVRSQPPEVQARVEQWASGSGNGSRGLEPGHGSTAPTPGPTGSHAVSSTGSTTPVSAGHSGNTPAGNAYGLAGSPPGPHGPGTLLDPGARAHGPMQSPGRTDALPSPMIQRVFNGEGGRPAAADNAVATPRPAGGEHLRADAGQVVAMPRNANGEAHRAEQAQSNPAQGNALLRGGEGHGPQRQDGLQNASTAASPRNDAPAPQQAGPTAHAATTQQATPQAAPQGTAQAGAFSTQQAATQAAAQQAGNRPMGGDLPAQQQLGARAAEGSVASPGVPDARPTLAAADPRGFTPQQALPSQAVPPAQARPDASQVMPQLAGLAIATNAPLPAVNTQPAQNAVAVAPGADGAATVRADALLMPAGHTLAGFLRRHARSGLRAANHPLGGWLLALVPARRRRGEDRPDAASLQWVFWITTVIAYGALAIAVIAMVPSRGRLFDDSGAPEAGAYALLVGALAVLASWWLGRSLAKRSGSG